MSRFLPDNLFVGVERERLSFVRRSRGFKPRVVETFTLPIVSDFWEKPDIDWVAHLLPPHVVSGTRAHIVIADRLVRYFLVERPQGARNAAEIKLAATLRFEELYGIDAQSWRIEMDFPPWTSNFLGCGLPERYLAVLLQLFESLHAPVHRIAPFGVEQWNRHANTLRAPDSCFVALSHDAAWLVLRRDRRWLAAVVHGLHGNKHAELPDLVRREFARHGLQEQWSKQTVFFAGAVNEEILSCLPNARLLSAAVCPDIDQHHAPNFQLALSPVWPVCE